MSISFETLALAKRYTNSAVADAIGGVAKIDFRFVTSLPLAGEDGVIYCVSNGGSEPDLYDEYYYVNGRFERIPGATIDLTAYATKAWVNSEGFYKKPPNGIPRTDLDDTLKASMLPSGGTTGQFLVKNSATNGDVGWVTVPNASGVNF